MNTRRYASVFRKKISLIIIMSVVTATVAVIATAWLPDKHTVSLSIAVDVNDRQETTDYKFSRYYGAEASEKFATTVASWFQSPEIVQRIFTSAGVAAGTTNSRSLAKIFDSEPLSSQNVIVDFTVSDPAEAEKLVAAMADIVAENTAVLNQDAEAAFVATMSEPVIAGKERSFLVNGVVGAIVGIIIGLAGAAALAYWQEDTEKSSS
jgi:capsular polysaccharide biosynthesis protein